MGMAISFHLYKKYIGERSEETAIALASAVSCQLLGHPSGHDTNLFLEENKHLVEEKLKQISDEPEICRITGVIAYAREQWMPQRASRATASERSCKLRALGIILPKDQVQVPESVAGLMHQARDFEIWTLNN